MKIRTDFVTNSSSASYILQFTLENEDGEKASMSLGVNPEDGYDSEDGVMVANDVEFFEHIGDQEKEEQFWKKAFAQSTVDELCDLLCNTAQVHFYGNGDDVDYTPWACERTCKGKNFVVGDVDEELDNLKWGVTHDHYTRDMVVEAIVEAGGIIQEGITGRTHYWVGNSAPGFSEFEDYREKYSKYRVEFYSPSEFEICFTDSSLHDPEYDYVNECVFYEDYFPETLNPIATIAPKTVELFKRDCKEAGITMDNLKSIGYRHSRTGWGDSAMYLESENPELMAYKERYDAASEEEKRIIVQELAAFMKSEPEMEIYYNSDCEAYKGVCVWARDEEKVAEKYLKGEDPKVWMAKWRSEVFTEPDGKQTCKGYYLLW